MKNIIIYPAKAIRTLDPNRPLASHVAVAEGRVLAVGGKECAEPWGGGIMDDRFADCVLMPGFVEGHAHVVAGALWAYPCVSYHEMVRPDGSRAPGLTIS